MSDKYYEVKVKISEDDLKDFLSNYCDEESIEEMNLDDEIVECVRGVLEDHFSDFYVLGKNTIFFEVNDD